MDNYRIKSYLMDGEQILWEGESGGKVHIVGRAGMVFPMIFGLFFFGFAVVWMTMAARSGGAFMPLFAIPFMLVGLAVAFGPIFSQRSRSKNCVYVVTDRRVIAFTKMGVNSVEYETVATVDVIYGKDDRGWIYMTRRGNYYAGVDYGETASYGRTYYANSNGKFELYDVKNVAEVYKIIVSARDKRLFSCKNDENRI